MPREEFEFMSRADGIRLRGYRFLCTSEERGAVVIAHGVAEHALRYARFAEALAVAGFSAYIYDHRGHGRTGESAGGLGSFGDAGWGGLVEDLVQAVDVVAEGQVDRPVFLFGHSMGSFAAQAAAPRVSRDIAGLILSGTADFCALAQFAAEAPDAVSLAAL
ncbi:MAG: alpha/beta fold hydrolase, partial [Pseudomonadota bacterium]